VNSVENLLRETFRSREKVVGEQTDLMTGVLARHRQYRRRAGVAAVVAGLAAVVVLVSGALVLRTAHPSRPAEPTVPRGWRTESSGGAEIIVPAAWTINEWGCGRETDRPTVVRGLSGPTLACAVRDSPIKSVAILDSFAPPGREDAYRATRHTVTINGVRAERSEIRLQDGRFAGQVMVPSRGRLPWLSLGVVVSTPDAAVGRRILDSFRLVDVDRNGCATDESRMFPGKAPARVVSLLPAKVTSITVCYYGEGESKDSLALSPSQRAKELLQAATVITGASAQALADGINAAPLEHEHSCPPEAAMQGPFAVLLARDRAGPPQALFVRSNNCGGGLINGSRQGLLIDKVAHQILDPVFGSRGWHRAGT
jgi:hypothetical protein